jgi:pimeloyl-ACP methyl ester carboxylesterase
VHERARGGRGIPLILTSGWPSCFAEFLPLVPRLTDPAAHGIEGPGFDVVIPSLPGYGFSDRPARTGVTCRYTAGLWHRLMRGLGYQHYGAHGSDFGAAVTTFMALDDPAPMLGIHLSNLDIAPYTGPGSPPLSVAEQAYLAQYQRWREDTEHARIAGRGGLPGTYPPDGPVIQTDRLCAAGTGQQGKDRGQAPPEPADTVQHGNQNVPRERSRLAGL